MRRSGYWFEVCSAADDYPFLVFDSRSHLHVHLSCFAKEALGQVSAATVRGYLSSLLPFFTYLDTDPWQRSCEMHWACSPDVVRQAVCDYLMQQFRCKIREHRLGFQLVSSTQQTVGGVRLFLAALKLFYRIMGRTGHYSGTNPLVDPLFTAIRAADDHLQGDSAAPQMPAISGVVPPRPRQRLTDSYFKFQGHEWQPHLIRDPTLFAQVLTAGARADWLIRDQVITRMLFETGARVSEVIGLTLGDWEARQLLQEATTFNKGSNGQRVKIVRFSRDTARLLRTYWENERVRYDRDQYRLEDYLTPGQRQRIDLFQVPLFLSQRGTPYTVKSYRDYAWKRSCTVAGLDLAIHQMRHWYVTQAMIALYELAHTDGEIQRRQEELIHYMHWKSGRATLAVYAHHLDLTTYREFQDGLHQRFDAQLHATLEQHATAGGASHDARTGSPVSSDLADPDLAFLQRLGGA